MNASRSRLDLRISALLFDTKYWTKLKDLRAKQRKTEHDQEVEAGGQPSEGTGCHESRTCSTEAQTSTTEALPIM